MNIASKVEKPKPDMKKYFAIQIILNFAGVGIVSLALASVVFHLFGDGTGAVFETQIFALGFIACFTVIQSHTSLVNARKDYLHGKWEGEESGKATSYSSWNPFRIIGPISLIAGIPAAVIIYFAAPFIGEGPFQFVTIVIISFVPLLISSSICIAIFLPKDQASFSRAMVSKHREDPKPLFSHTLIEYILPWFPIQVLLNAGIGYKQFNFEMLKTAAIEAGGLPLHVVAADAGIVFGILFFFLSIGSDTQVRADVRLGRVAQKEFHSSKLQNSGIMVSVLLLIGSSILFGTIAGLLFGGVASLLGISTFTVMHACVIKAIFAVLGFFVGCNAGIWYGTRRESVLIKKGA